MKKNFVLVAALVAALALGGRAQAQANTVYGQSAANSEVNSNADISVFGYQALYACQYCYGTSAMGYQALRVSSGNYNVALGIQSMYNSTSGSGNTGVGAFTLYNLGTGNYNVAVGYGSGNCATVNGSDNIWISHCGLAKDNAVIRIGTPGTQRFTAIAGIYESKVIGGRAVVIDSKGHLGYAVTKVVPNTVAASATQADVLALRQEIAALHNEVYALKARAH